MPPKSPNTQAKHQENAESPTWLTTNRIMVGAILLMGGVFGAAAISGGVKGGRSTEKLSSDEVEKIEAKKKELYGVKSIDAEYGGDFYKMSRMPGMTEAHPKMKGVAYVNIPEDADTDRLVFFYHGNGGQVYKDVNIANLVKCTKEAKVPLIAPQDIRHEKRKGTLPGSWADYKDPEVISTMIDFVGGLTGRVPGNVELHSFSGGNVGVAKTLDGILHPSEKNESLAEDLRSQISRIVLYDSEDGISAPYIAEWMSENSSGEVFSYYNTGGDDISRKYFFNGWKAYADGNQLLRDKTKKYESRVVSEPLPKNLNGQHAVIESMCKKYLDE